MHEDATVGTTGTLVRVIDWIYDSVTAGSIELAESYVLRNKGDREKSINDLVRWHVCYAGIVGFTSGFGGALNAAVMAPLTISSVVAIQMRMIAAIAHLRGYSLHDQKVRTLVFICLTGSSVGALLQDLGYTAGKRLRDDLVSSGSKAAAQRFHSVLGRHLGARYVKGKTAPRVAPVISGVIGSLFDAGMTHGISSTARIIFRSVPRHTALLTHQAA